MYVWTWIQLTTFGLFTPADSLGVGRSQAPFIPLYILLEVCTYLF